MKYIKSFDGKLSWTVAAWKTKDTESNFKINLRKAGCKNKRQIELAKDNVQWQALAFGMLYFPVPQPQNSQQQPLNYNYHTQLIYKHFTSSHFAPSAPVLEDLLLAVPIHFRLRCLVNGDLPRELAEPSEQPPTSSMGSETQH
jgi:hypothetical protein